MLTLSRLFDLRPGEGVRVLRMFTLLGLIIATSYILKPVRSALFLSQVGSEQLPYVYILVAMVLGLVAAAFARFAPRADLSRLLVTLSCLFAVSLVGFWLAVVTGWSWTGYVFYVWASIFTALMPSLFWLLANYVFYANEGRRLFSVVTAGGLLGSILGGAVTSLLATRVGTPGLLLVAALVLFGIAGLARVTATRERNRIRERRSDLERQERVRSTPSDERPMELITRSRYLTMLTAIVLLAGLSSTLLDYQFNTVVEHSFGSRDELTRFFGAFFAGINVLAFLLQLFLAGRILGRLGVMAGLALLPLAVLGSSLAFLIRPSLVTAALLKTADDGLGNSINRSSIEVLYLPVALAVKNRIKTWVDLFVERMSRGLAGLVILGATALSIGVSHLSLVLLVILVPWVLLVVSLRRAYVETFRESLARRDITDLASVLNDPGSARVFHQVLASGDEREIAYALELLPGVEDPVLLEDARRLASHENPLIRAAAIRALTESSSPPPLPDFERSIRDEDIVAGAEALALWMRVEPEAGAAAFERWVDSDEAERISALLDCLDGSKELVSSDVLTRIIERHGKSESPSRRGLAAKAIGFLSADAGKALDGTLLPELIDDPDVDVARDAATSAGKRRAPEAFPALVKGLARHSLRTRARMAISRFGAEGVVELEKLLEDETLPISLRLTLPRAIAEIVDPRAVRALFRVLPSANLHLHYQAIKGLSRLRSHGPSLRFPRVEVDALLDYECAVLLGHSRMLAALRRSSPRGTDGSYRLLVSVLGERIEFARERMFRALGLVYPQREMAGVWSRLAYAEPSVRANALEYLANLLSGRHRRSLFPVLDTESQPASLVSGRGLPGEAEPSLEDALLRLVQSEDDWLAACAVTAAGKLGLASLVPLLDRARERSSPLVREAALQALSSLTEGGIGSN